MFLGFALAWFLIQFSQGEDRLFRPIIALWIIALPLLDTVSIMARRVRIGRSPFAADRAHFHHILLSAGFSERKTLAIMVMLALAAVVAISVGLARCPFAGFDPVEMIDFGLYVVLWGVVGARVFHVFENLDKYPLNWGGISGALAVWNGGLVFYGGMMGAMIEDATVTAVEKSLP